ncbi:MAG: hypothetical protein MUC43_18105 [Pirellula sp.]|nr:hypothetical protein [Pirellula sp.]
MQEIVEVHGIDSIDPTAILQVADSITAVANLAKRLDVSPGCYPKSGDFGYG